jgi:hypothetical protein
MVSLLSSAVDQIRKRAQGATRLANIDVRNVAIVKHPANRRKFLVLKADGSIAEARPPLTFDSALFGRKVQHVYAGLSEHYGALLETLESIRTGRDPHTGVLVEAALDDFVEKLETAMPKLLAQIDTADDARIVKGALAKLQKAHAVIGELIAQAEGGEEDGMGTKKLTAEDYQRIGNQLAELVIDEIRKQQSSTPVDELEHLVTERANAGDTLPRDLLRFEILTANADLARRLKAFIQNRDSAHEKALKAIIARVETAPGGISPADYAAKSGGAIGELDRRVRARMAKSTVAETYTVALNAVSLEDPALEKAARAESTFLTSGGTLANRDAALAKSGAGSAVAEVQQKIDAILAKSSTLDRAAAQAQVFDENPGLYERYRQEAFI